jgi:hypothetical protein
MSGGPTDGGRRVTGAPISWRGVQPDLWRAIPDTCDQTRHKEWKEKRKRGAWKIQAPFEAILKTLWPVQTRRRALKRLPRPMATNPNPRRAIEAGSGTPSEGSYALTVVTPPSITDALPVV